MNTLIFFLKYNINQNMNWSYVFVEGTNNTMTTYSVEKMNMIWQRKEKDKKWSDNWYKQAKIGGYNMHPLYIFVELKGERRRSHYFFKIKYFKNINCVKGEG